jgi:hypothetical protein
MSNLLFFDSDTPSACGGVVHFSTLPALSEADRAVVNTLQNEGVCVTSLNALGIPGSDRLLKTAQSLTETLPSKLTPNPADDWHVGNHAVMMGTVLLASEYPDIYLWGFQKRLLAIISHYIQQPVAYLATNVRRDIPNGKQTGTRIWHRDAEDHRMIKVIIYLTDTGLNNGPFEYIPKALTPAYDAFGNASKILDDGMRRVIPESEWKACPGPAGTVIFADTASVWHHGKMPLSERFALFFTYTSKRPIWLNPYKGCFSKENARILNHSLSLQQKRYLLWRS